MNSNIKSPLYTLANPESIVFFGASNSFSAMGTNILVSLLASGFPGPVYPVHPTEKTVRKLTAYESVLDLPQAPDLAVMVLPTRLVCETMEACGKKGVKSAVVVTAGFSEVSEEGAREEEKLVAIAKKYGIRFLGPNCLGVANPHKKLNTTFFRAEGRPGYIGLASQSGSFVTQMFNYLARLGTGFSTAFSVGNAKNIDLVDCLEYLGECPHTKVIAMYVEGLERGREFLDVAKKVSLKKPIVALYVGGSDEGKKAGQSHTGAMAGPERLYDGVFRQSGIIRARSVTELFDFCRALGALPRPGGRGVAIQTHSGGPGAASADACGRAGLKLASFTDDTIKKLGEYVPRTGSTGNPVDITYSKNPMDFFKAIPEVLLGDEHTDMLLVYYLMPTELVLKPMRAIGLPEDEAIEKSHEWLDLQAMASADIMKKLGKAIVGVTFRGLSERFPETLMKCGVPVYSDPEAAARALSALCRYWDWREKMDRV